MIAPECLESLRGKYIITFKGLVTLINKLKLSKLFDINDLKRFTEPLSTLDDMAKLLWATERQVRYANILISQALDTGDLTFLAPLLLSQYFFQEFAKSGNYRLSFNYQYRMAEAFFLGLLNGKNKEVFNAILTASAKSVQEFHRLFEVCKDDNSDKKVSLYNEGANFALTGISLKEKPLSYIGDKYQFHRAASKERLVILGT